MGIGIKDEFFIELVTVNLIFESIKKNEDPAICGIFSFST